MNTYSFYEDIFVELCVRETLKMLSGLYVIWALKLIKFNGVYPYIN